MKKDFTVILVDMQEFFLKHLEKDVRNELIKNQIKIIDFCTKNNIPIFLTEYKCSNVFRGEIIPQLKRKIKTSKGTIVKLHNSGFTKTELDRNLKDLRIKKLLIMGVNGNGCVQDTAIGALHRGYKVFIAKGTIASAGRKDLGFSTRNERWLKDNTYFLQNTSELLKLLSK